MSNVKITVLFVLILVFIMPAVLSLGIRYLPDREVPQTGGSVKISRDNKLEFNLVGVEGNLVGIGVVVKNPQRSSSDLRFKISDQGGNILRESVVNGLSIPDGAQVKFIFPPLTFKGQTLQGRFISGANEENTMEIYLEKDKDIPAFISYYKPSSRLILIGNIYSGWLRRIF